MLKTNLCGEILFQVYSDPTQGPTRSLFTLGRSAAFFAVTCLFSSYFCCFLQIFNKTIYKAIKCLAAPPFPVSSRLWGLPKDFVKMIENILRVKWTPLLVLDRFFHTCMFFQLRLGFNSTKIDLFTLCSLNQSSKRTQKS